MICPRFEELHDLIANKDDDVYFTFMMCTDEDPVVEAYNQ